MLPISINRITEADHISHPPTQKYVMFHKPQSMLIFSKKAEKEFEQFHMEIYTTYCTMRPSVSHGNLTSDS